MVVRHPFFEFVGPHGQRRSRVFRRRVDVFGRIFRIHVLAEDTLGDELGTADVGQRRAQRLAKPDANGPVAEGNARDAVGHTRGVLRRAGDSLKRALVHRLPAAQVGFDRELEVIDAESRAVTPFDAIAQRE